MSFQDPHAAADLPPEPTFDGPLDHAMAWLESRIGDPDATETHDETGELRAGRTTRWLSRTIMFATLTLFILNAVSLKTWASTLAPNWGTETIRILSAAWVDRLAEIGLDQPRAQIHAAYEAEKAKSWKAVGGK